RYDVANASELKFTRAGGMNELSAITRLCAFCDDNEDALLPFSTAVPNGIGNAGEVEGDLGDEDDVCAPCETAVEGNPPGVSSHDFGDHDAFVTLGGGVQPVEGVSDTGHSRVKAEAHGGGADVIINGFRY